MSDQPLSEADIARFWSKVDRRGDEECWPWIGGRNYDGYGQFGTRTGGKNTAHRAHRLAYMLTIGPIPEGLTLDHLCRVRHCVNPSHLEVVTNRENVLRGDGLTAREARQTHCLRGHPFDEVNTRYHLGPQGAPYRVCRACERLREASRPKRVRV